MRPGRYPVFQISHLVKEGSLSDLFNAGRLEGYLADNPQLHVAHGHDFYHLAFFTEGTGTHVLDFEKFPLRPGALYFMRPGQVHRWAFDTEPKGFLINFSPDFLHRSFLRSESLDLWPFWGPEPSSQTVYLDEGQSEDLRFIFETILKEQTDKDKMYPLVIAALMMRLFALALRAMPEAAAGTGANSAQAGLIWRFRALLDQHFKTLRLPRDYAGLLHVTPGYLNEACREVCGVSTGEAIRQRVMLEAKRLLVNFGSSIGDVARALHFEDGSYFARFFKKHEGIGPEAFRKAYREGEREGIPE